MTYPPDHPGSWYTWLVQDQRFVDKRPDVLTWETEELTARRDLGRAGDREIVCLNHGYGRRLGGEVDRRLPG